MKDEAIEKLKKLTSEGVKKSQIEKDLGMPQNSLSAIMSGKKELPKKYLQPVLMYSKVANGELAPYTNEKTPYSPIVLPQDTFIKESQDLIAAQNKTILALKAENKALLAKIEEMGRNGLQTSNKPIVNDLTKPEVKGTVYDPNENPRWKMKMGIK